MKGFTSTYNKGFRMGFENGFSISVQWGTGNYCEVKTLPKEINTELQEPFWSSSNAEIAVFDKEGGMIDISNDDVVIGWVTPDNVAKIISIIQLATTTEEMTIKIKSLNI
jgi:hypothetical protein|tara:strand:- start:39 stop:368 length:330 start_codon:yes stop_codon:yes gene_type:complete